MEIKSAWTIKVQEKEYKLTEPSFEVQSKGMTKYMFSGDGLNPIEAGSIIFDACYLGKDLEEIKKDVKLYSNLCLQASKIIEIYEGELKKN